MLKPIHIILILILVVSCQTSPNTINTKKDLTISPQDTEILEIDSGIILYVKAKPDIKSIKLYSHTHDINGEYDIFGYRSRTYNEVNGNELYLYRNKLVKNEYFFLIDSTPVPHHSFGYAFSFLIPKELVYGYKHINNETVVKLESNLFINICTFPLKNISYKEGYYDNPFNLILRWRII